MVISGGNIGPVRVYILDDHEVVRRGLRSLLEDDGMLVIGEAGSAAEAAARIPALKPDVAVLDARLGDGTGTAVCRHVRSVDPAIRCLVLATDYDERALRRAVQSGAAGYFPKDVGSEELVAAIRRTAAGEILFDPEQELEALEGVPQTIHAGRPEGLTVQETRVLELLAHGKTNRQIAHDMALAEKTAKNYVSSVLAKLGVERRTQAALYAAKAKRRGRAVTGAVRHVRTSGHRDRHH